MKPENQLKGMTESTVAPYAGAWIETSFTTYWDLRKKVAPYAGAWIETSEASDGMPRSQSLPTRERGLKQQELQKQSLWLEVAPYAGAWIETQS